MKSPFPFIIFIVTMIAFTFMVSGYSFLNGYIVGYTNAKTDAATNYLELLDRIDKGTL